METGTIQRGLAALLMALSFAIAPVAGLLAWEAGKAGHPHSSHTPADPAIARAFYAAIDRVVAGESSDALRAMLAVDFVDSTQAGPENRSAGQLIDDLTTFGRTFPHAQFELAGLETLGDTIVARVRVTMPVPARIAGITVASEPDGVETEILRVHNGKIVRRWAPARPPQALSSFTIVAGSNPILAPMAARLTRITLEEGARFTWQAEDRSLVLAEREPVPLTVDLANQGRELAVTHSTITVTPGTAASLPNGASVLIWNDAPQIMTFLLFTAHYDYAGLTQPIHLKGAATSKLLWESPEPIDVPGAWQIEAARLDLPPRRTFRFGNTGAVQLAICSEGASILVDAQDGGLAAFDDRYRMAAVPSPHLLAPGEAVSISSAGSVTLSIPADSAAAAWAITFGPVSSSTPETPS